MNITLKAFIIKEFKQALRDYRMRLLIFFVPIVQLMIFGFAISTEVKNIRLGFSYAQNDTVARHIYERAIASKWFLATKTNSKDPFQMVQSGEADVVIVAPDGGLTKAIEKGNGEVQLLINSTNMLRAQSAERYMKMIVLEVIESKQNSPAIGFNIRLLYNPSMESAVFMVPGVMCMIVCVLSVILTSMSISKEKELNTLEMLISAPIKPWELILGKTIPYFILGLINIPFILIAAVIVFGVPIRGPMWAIALSSVAFIATTVSIGILISTFAKNQQQGMLGGFLFAFPAIMLSGIMFPLENMPLPLKVVAYINPLSYFVTLLRNILLKGGDTELIISHLVVLLLIACLTIWISTRRFQKNLS